MPLSISHQGETGIPLVCRFHDHIPDKGNHRAVLKPVGESLALVLMQGGMCLTNPRQSTVLPDKPSRKTLGALHGAITLSVSYLMPAA
jgi:hypothetical protein